MRDDVRAALEIELHAPAAKRTIDITTTGRASGEPRRIEIWYYRADGEIYLSGLPFHKTRDWLANLAVHPEFTFHLKGEVSADLAARATIITDESARRRVLAVFVTEANRRHELDGSRPESLDKWVAESPLALVEFLD
jgi:deazaflavin-dependent oxidoreductase (nitroreductase family)